jgi:hypothetical protein
MSSVRNGSLDVNTFKRSSQFVDFFCQSFSWKELEEQSEKIDRLLDLLCQRLIEISKFEQNGDQITNLAADCEKCITFLDGFFNESHIFPDRTLSEVLLMLIPEISLNAISFSSLILALFQRCLKWFSHRPNIVEQLENCQKALICRIIQLQWKIIILKEYEQLKNKEQKQKLFDILYSIWQEIDIVNEKRWKRTNEILNRIIFQVRINFFFFCYFLLVYWFFLTDFRKDILLKIIG